MNDYDPRRSASEPDFSQLTREELLRRGNSPERIAWLQRLSKLAAEAEQSHHKVG